MPDVPHQVTVLGEIVRPRNTRDDYPARHEDARDFGYRHVARAVTNADMVNEPAVESHDTGAACFHGPDQLQRPATRNVLASRMPALVLPCRCNRHKAEELIHVSEHMINADVEDNFSLGAVKSKYVLQVPRRLGKGVGLQLGEVDEQVTFFVT